MADGKYVACDPVKRIRGFDVDSADEETDDDNDLEVSRGEFAPMEPLTEPDPPASDDQDEVRDNIAKVS